jgi:methylenetetrahydrofolate dehydrogenase (NADP+) / methenyltetrahydrofolate cyclohydrolase
MTNQILGGKILKLVKERCQPHNNYFQRKLITIIMFQPPKQETDAQKLAQYEAAVTSTSQKVKTFQFLSCDVNRLELPVDTSRLRFRKLIKEAANDFNSIGIIVQNPVPKKELKEELINIPSQLDIDGINQDNSLFKASATSEAIARLTESFALPGDKVAVLGSLGFVGSGVVLLLKEKGIEVIKLDKAKGDSDHDIKEGVLSADIVISATGKQDLITQDYLKPAHKLVLDAGFVPLADGTILGDVAKDAYNIPQNLTPVPGGIGPTQMAVLLERLMKVAKIEIQPWNYKQDFLEPASNINSQTI